MVQRPHRSLLVFAATALLAGCARQTISAPEPARPVHIPLDAGSIAAVAELLRMEDSRLFDGPLVSRHLESPVAEVRARAALAAGRVRSPDATPLLLRALADSAPAVRARAAFALGQLGDSSAAVVTALSAIALRDEVGSATEAVFAIGRLAGPAARPVIDSLLTPSVAAPSVLHETLLVAWRLPRDAGTLARIVHWTKDPNAETRWRAAYALARGSSPGAVLPLLDIAGDPDARVRGYAVRGMRVALADSAGVRERALTALMLAAQDSHPHVRINALGLLAGYTANERTTPILTRALHDPDPNVALTAAQALALAADPAGADALRTAALSLLPDGLRAAALHAWIRVDSAMAAATALQWADSSRWLLRMHAARALARAPLSAAVPALHRLARDSHYLVAAEALGSVRSIADSLPDSRRLYIEQLAGAHPLVRAAALRGLATHVGPADLDLLLQAWDRARQDSVRDAGMAAILALARVRRAGVPVRHSFFLRFGAHGPPRDGVLHRAVIDSIGSPPASWGEPRGRIQVQPLSFYTNIVRSLVAPVLAGEAPPRAVISTGHGDVVLELAAADAPLTVHNFISLIERGYYHGTRWHRVVPNFVIQDGDPRGDGSGGPGYAIRDEINSLRYGRGTLGMALSGPDTGGSQYFITHSPQPHLDGGYTVFGHVAAGMEVVDRVVQDDAITALRVIR